MKLALLAIVSLAVACSKPLPLWPNGDAKLYGIQLEIQDPAYDTDEIKADIKFIIEQTSSFYEHNPNELAGLRIIIRSGRVQCGDVSAVGCRTWDDNTITLSTDLGCIWDMSLAHEILHYYIDDQRHEGTQWKTLDITRQQQMNGKSCSVGCVFECKIPQNETCSFPYCCGTVCRS